MIGRDLGGLEGGRSVKRESVVKLRFCTRFFNLKTEKLVDDGSEERKKE